MVHFEHINLVVSNIERSLSFYQAAFPHWRIRGGGQGTWYGKPRQWLHFGDEYQYIALSDNGEGTARELSGHQPGLAHFAFVVTSLDKLSSRLTAAGYSIAQDGAADAGRRNLYFIDPDGLEVEFVEYLSDEPQVRNHYPA